MTRFPRPETLRRAASAAVLAPAALALAWTGGVWLAAALALSAWIMSFEWSRMLGGEGLARHAPALAALVAGGAALSLGEALQAAIAAPAAAAAAGMAFAPGGRRAAWGVAGPLAIGIPLVLAWQLREGAPGGRELLLWCLLVVWATDTAAWAGGRLLGGRRLAPAVSPAKTWSGAAAGLVSAGLAGGAAGAACGWEPASSALGGLALGAAAQAGDLAESAAKRAHGRKDAGGLIPGHGGLLDRLDGFLAAVAALGAWTLLGGPA